jgi:hypothetical protein
MYGGGAVGVIPPPVEINRHLLPPQTLEPSNGINTRRLKGGEEGNDDPDREDKVRNELANQLPNNLDLNLESV